MSSSEKVASKVGWKEALSKARPFIIVFLILLLILLSVSGAVSLTGLFNVVLLEPMLNILILLSKYLFGSFGLAIIALTIIIRVLTLYFTVRQLRSASKMQDVQAEIKELQKKYAKDKQQLGQKTMEVYKKHGVSPLGCAFPMLIQFPIWIGLYQSVIQALAYAPENLLGLSKHLYSWSAVQGLLPLNNNFLWLDLRTGDIIMAVLTGGSMWVLQKMSTRPSTDPTQESMSRMMLWIMPLMFGFMALSLPSGLSVYWVASNIISIVIQYRITGWGTLKLPALADLRGGLRKPANVLEKTAGSPGDRKRSAAGGVTTPQEEAGVSSANPRPKGTVGGDIIPQGKKVSQGKQGGKGEVGGRVRRIRSERKKDRHGKHRDNRKV